MEFAKGEYGHINNIFFAKAELRVGQELKEVQKLRSA